VEPQPQPQPEPPEREEARVENQETPIEEPLQPREPQEKPEPLRPGGRTRSARAMGALLAAAFLLYGGWLWYSHRGAERNQQAGGLDPTFNAGTNADREIRVALVQQDGKIVIGGLFTRFGGSRHRGIARLNPDGSIDEAFSAIAGGDVHA